MWTVLLTLAVIVLVFACCEALGNLSEDEPCMN